VAGAGTRLIAASPREQERLAEVAAGFSEDDLTRYLQLTLDLFKDLQFSLQPRLHLEIGLLRLVQAGKLLPIEEALANLGNPSSSTPVKPAPAKPAGATQRNRPASPHHAATSASGEGPWRDRLHATLLELGMQFTADAVEHSQVTEAGASCSS
jgi:DNA polymerase III subunit gamma/tau